MVAFAFRHPAWPPQQWIGPMADTDTDAGRRSTDDYTKEDHRGDEYSKVVDHQLGTQYE